MPTVGALEYAHGSSLHEPQGTARRLRDEVPTRQEPPAPPRPCPSCCPWAGHPAGRVCAFTGTLPSFPKGSCLPPALGAQGTVTSVPLSCLPAQCHRTLWQPGSCPRQPSVRFCSCKMDGHDSTGNPMESSWDSSWLMGGALSKPPLSLLFPGLPGHLKHGADSSPVIWAVSKIS